MRSKALALMLAALIFIGLALLLFWPQPIEGTTVGAFLANSLANFFDPSGSQHGLTIRALEQWMNFLIFIPFSGLLFFVFKRNGFVWSLFISISMSAAAELTQLLVLHSRVASPEDLLLNSSGALLGTTLAWLASRLYKLRRP